jgi:hypothetical protein
MIKIGPEPRRGQRAPGPEPQRTQQGAAVWGWVVLVACATVVVSFAGRYEAAALGGGATQQGGATQAGGATQQPAGAARTAKAAAVFDPTGYWVPLVTEDWRFRMVTPPKGDYASVPLTAEGRRVADTWDLAKDDAAGNQCKAYGVGGITRQPGRLHITWDNDTTLKLEYDAGQQMRLLHFDAAAPAGQKTWQGTSIAEWDVPTGRAAAGNAVGAGGTQGRVSISGRPGAIKVVTTNMREGYLRKNGVPYSENAIITEFIDRLGPEPDGAVYLLIRTMVEDPKYLQQPFVTSTHFRLEANGSKWNPTPCKTDPPAPVK